MISHCCRGCSVSPGKRLDCVGHKKNGMTSFKEFWSQRVGKHVSLVTELKGNMLPRVTSKKVLKGGEVVAAKRGQEITESYVFSEFDTENPFVRYYTSVGHFRLTSSKEADTLVMGLSSLEAHMVNVASPLKEIVSLFCDKDSKMVLPFLASPDLVKNPMYNLVQQITAVRMHQVLGMRKVPGTLPLDTKKCKVEMMASSDRVRKLCAEQASKDGSLDIRITVPLFRVTMTALKPLSMVQWDAYVTPLLEKARAGGEYAKWEAEVERLEEQVKGQTLSPVARKAKMRRLSELLAEVPPGPMKDAYEVLARSKDVFAYQGGVCSIFKGDDVDVRNPMGGVPGKNPRLFVDTEAKYVLAFPLPASCTYKTNPYRPARSVCAFCKQCKQFLEALMMT